MPYIQCSANNSGDIECKGIANPTTPCSSSTIGTLVTDGELCLGMNGETAIKSTFLETAKNFLLAHASGSIFTTIAEKQYGVVEIKSNSMIINTTFQSDYGVCVNNGEVVSAATSTSGGCTSPETKSTAVDFCYKGVCFLTCKVSATSRDSNCKLL